MMRKMIPVAALCLLASLGEAREPLFRDGTSSWKISIPARPSAPELHAAAELARMLEKISGARLVVEKSDSAPASNTIVIGSLETSPVVRGKNDALKLQKDIVENLAVHTVGDNLYLAGNNPRGALYAVYTFLQDSMGARWLWPGDDGEFFQKRKSFDLPDMAFNYKPRLRFREMTPCYEQSDEPTQVWLARNFLNGGARTASIRDSGGFFRHDGQHWVVLSRKDFDKYPQYFSLIGGKRVPEGQAGCWSNPGFLKLMVEKHLKLIEQNNFEIMKTIHADITQRCECPDCVRNPDPSSRWFEFLDKLVREIHKTHPSVLFAGSAYQEHRKVPADDINGLEYVEYCHYNRCYVHKLGDPGCKLNSHSMDELARWQKKIAMGIYGYEFDVFEPFMYVPFWNMLADEIRTFADMGVVRVKTELPVIHRRTSTRSDDTQQKMRLSNYIYARLAWNPGLDADELLQEWCRIVYGAASEPMLEYHRAMASAWDNMKIHLSYFFSSPGGAAAHLLDDKLTAFASKKFAEARAAASNIPDESARDRVLADIAVDQELFSEWEKLYRVTGVDAVACLPKLPDGSDFSRLKLFPMAAKKDSALPAETRMFWSDSALRIQVVCMTPDMKSLRQGAKGRDVTLWADDNVELFLDMNDGFPYRHLAANPAGGVFDATADDISWNPEWRAVPKLRDDRWIMDITLPFSSFGGRRPKDGEQWKIMVIRNGKAGSRGYPAAAHHDMSRAATLSFSEKAAPGKSLLWLSSPSLAEGRRFVKIMPALLKRGWQFDNAVSPEAVARKDPSLFGMIVVEKYKSAIPLDFYRDKIIPAVNDGATLVFSSYFWLDDLPKIFGDETFKVRFVENAAKLRKVSSVADNSFSKTPNDFRKILKYPPSGTLAPLSPEKWEVLAAQQTSDGGEMPFIIARPLGKGMVVVCGDVKENVQLLENLLEYNRAIKR